MRRVSSFTFGTYTLNTARSSIAFTYRVEYEGGRGRTYTDRLFFEDIAPEQWESVPKAVLEPTLRALLLMIGINYWCVFATRDIRIQGWSLTREQARFWDTLYLNGLGEFFYKMQMDFRDLIAFPYDESLGEPAPARFARPSRALLLNGAGKDSILSAEILKQNGTPFDFFAFAPTPAHARVAKLVGARTIRVTRRRDPRLGLFMSWHGVSGDYPSVSTFTFVATLLAELLGYDSIVFSNERSADFGNLDYLGLHVNHQWCKSSEAEELTNGYIRRYITPDISTKSLLREYSELEIVRRFIRYRQYLRTVTSCNNYFWLPRPMQLLSRTSYWCKKCPKCVFLFACFAAFLPKKDVVRMFGADLFSDTRLLPLMRQILGIEGFKPLDCVGEPEEMALAMHLALQNSEYTDEPATKLFEENVSDKYDFGALPRKVFARD
jgi:hypothetical protein